MLIFQNDKERGIPVMKKPAEKSKDDESSDNGEFDELFPSDLSDDEDDEERFLLKEERGGEKKLKDSSDSVKKSTKKSNKEDSEKKQPTKNTKAKAVPVPDEVEDEELDDGEDIADEVVDFDMSEEDDD